MQKVADMGKHGGPHDLDKRYLGLILRANGMVSYKHVGIFRFLLGLFLDPIPKYLWNPFPEIKCSLKPEGKDVVGRR